MFSADDIYSLTEFQRNAKEHVTRLLETKRPEVLTVNGKAKVVVQDAQAYQEMVDLIDTIQKVKIAAVAYDRGEGRPIEEAFAEMDARLKEKYG